MAFGTLHMRMGSIDLVNQRFLVLPNISIVFLEFLLGFHGFQDVLMDVFKMF